MPPLESTPANALLDSTPIIRFLTIPKFTELLSGKLWSPSLESLSKNNDPFEGNPELYWTRFPDLKSVETQLFAYAGQTPELQFDVGDQRQKRWIVYLHFLRHHRAVSCWFQGPFESYPMWEAYAKNGVAVVTTVGKLKMAVGYDPEKHCLAEVTYFAKGGGGRLNWNQAIQGKVDPCFLKRNEFSGEKEIRLVARMSGEKPGIKLPLRIPLSKWVDYLIVYPFPTLREFEAADSHLRLLLESKGIQIPIEPSAVRESSYKSEQLYRAFECDPEEISDSYGECSAPLVPDTFPLGKFPE